MFTEQPTKYTCVPVVYRKFRMPRYWSIRTRLFQLKRLLFSLAKVLKILFSKMSVPPVHTRVWTTSSYACMKHQFIRMYETPVHTHVWNTSSYACMYLVDNTCSIAIRCKIPQKFWALRLYFDSEVKKVIHQPCLPCQTYQRLEPS